MTHDEFETSIEHLSDPTKTYLRGCKELFEGYVGRMNAVNYNVPLVYQLQKLLEKEAKALYAEYLAELKRQGLPREVGWMSSPRPLD